MLPAACCLLQVAREPEQQVHYWQGLDWHSPSGRTLESLLLLLLLLLKSTLSDLAESLGIVQPPV